MTNFVYPVASKGTVNFLEGLAAAGDVTALNAIPGVPAVNSRRFFIRSVAVKAMENIGMTFLFYSNPTGPTLDVDTDAFISSFGFVAGQGVRSGGAGLYRYYVDGLSIPYYLVGSGNSIVPPTLNVVLQLQGVTAKTADAPGAIQATFHLEPASAMG
jgi:hypothetical protein